MNIIIKDHPIWASLLLISVNLILIGFLFEEIIDASPPNYGRFSLFWSTALGLISYAIIDAYEKAFKKEILTRPVSYLIWLIQGLNCFFITFPIIVFAYFTLVFI